MAEYILPDNKICTKCAKLKPISEFALVFSTRQGYTRPRGACKKCLAAQSRRSHFFKKYGIKLRDYQIMYNAQRGKCFLCLEGGPEILPNGRPRLHMDHNHQTGSLRKLLCNTCNWRIGMIENLPDGWYDRARSYLDEE